MQAQRKRTLTLAQESELCTQLRNQHGCEVDKDQIRDGAVEVINRDFSVDPPVLAVEWEKDFRRRHTPCGLQLIKKRQSPLARIPMPQQTKATNQLPTPRRSQHPQLRKTRDDQSLDIPVHPSTVSDSDSDIYRSACEVFESDSINDSDEAFEDFQGVGHNNPEHGLEILRNNHHTAFSQVSKSAKDKTHTTSKKEPKVPNSDRPTLPSQASGDSESLSRTISDQASRKLEIKGRSALKLDSKSPHCDSYTLLEQLFEHLEDDCDTVGDSALSEQQIRDAAYECNSDRNASNFNRVQKIHRRIITFLQCKHNRNTVCEEHLKKAANLLPLLHPSNEIPIYDHTLESFEKASRTGEPAILFPTPCRNRQKSPEERLAELFRAARGKIAVFDSSTKTATKEATGGRSWTIKQIRDHIRRRLRNHASIRGALASGSPDKFKEPINMTNLAGIPKVERPRWMKAEAERFELVNDIGIPIQKSTPLRDRMTVSALEFLDGLLWMLFTEEDAISPFHRDRHALNTLIVPQFGEKLWIMIVFEDSERGQKARAEYIKQGTEFDPSTPGSKLRWAFINENNAMIMFRSVPHFVLTTKLSVFYGESFADAYDLNGFLRDAIAEYEEDGFDKATNEPASRQFEDWLLQLLETLQCDQDRDRCNITSDDELEELVELTKKALRIARWYWNEDTAHDLDDSGPRQTRSRKRCATDAAAQEEAKKCHKTQKTDTTQELTGA